MEEENKSISVSISEGLWTSPLELYPSHIRKEKGLIMSTPNLPQWNSTLSSSLESNESSSRQDSGYSSLTSSSITPVLDTEFISEKCPWCSKISTENDELSPPQSICNCKRKYMPKNRSSHLEYMQTISEANSTPAGLFLSRGRPNAACDLFDEPMDTSLYPDELEGSKLPCESNVCLVSPLEMGEEKSIDFMDSSFYLSKNTSSNKSKIKEDESFVESCKIEEFFSPTLMFGCDSTTPIIRDNSLLTQENKERNFSSVAKRVVTINRVVKSFSLNGIEKIDILYQLTSNRLNCPHIVSKIFSYLSAKDLHSVGRVSKAWHELVCNDYDSYNRWKLYGTTMNIIKENLTSPKKESAPGSRARAGVGVLSPLQCIQNEIRPQLSAVVSNSRRSPPVSPQSARFRSFQKAAKTLKTGERLLPCPKCYFPSHDHGSPTVQCSRSGCRHRFCVWCRNEIISSLNHNCPPGYTPRYRSNSSYKIPAVGSKSCKRKLRRLTLD